MKSIKEKAKAYDEAIERARYWEKNPTVWSSDDICQKLFPELKESEDERIRKALAAHFVKFKYSDMWENGISFGDVLVWLEKQGKPYTKRDVDDAYLEGVTNTKNEIEKQCEQKLPIEKLPFKMKTPEESLGIDSDTYSKIVDECIYGEQKPTDKVEPKFHNGEWLCENEPNNYARFIQILETVNVQGKKRYRISRDIHNDEDVVEFDFVEKYYHRFDIKDVKDGDVLCSGQIVVIFKHFEDPSYRQHIVAYIGLDACGNVQITDGTWTLGIDKAKPATKEQRDLLFKKMHEAGYEWDAEKKELIKIDQNFILNEVQPKQITPEEPAWSEDDEDYRLNANVAFDDYFEDEYAAELRDWLKHLKDRYAWKPSKAQIKAIEDAIEFLGCTKKVREDLKSLRKQLKKLRRE